MKTRDKDLLSYVLSFSNIFTIETPEASERERLNVAKYKLNNDRTHPHSPNPLPPAMKQSSELSSQAGPGPSPPAGISADLLGGQLECPHQ